MNKDVQKPFVRTENTFPQHDEYWCQARDALLNFREDGPILAPFEFSEHFAEIEPVQFSYFKPTDYYQFVVINKAQIDRYSDEFISSIQSSYKYVYGNPVFNIYFKGKSELAGDPKHEYRSSDLSERVKGGVRSYRRSSIGMRFSKFLRKKRPVVLVVSASQFGNAGDDAITEAAVSLVKQALSPAEILLARPPFSRRDVDQADMIVLGGGGILYDSCFNNAMNYCDYLFYAHSLGKKTFGIGLGTQGIKSERGRELYKRALDTCEVLVVRNGRDEEILKDFCGVEAPIYTTNDIVFQFGNDVNREDRTPSVDSKKLKVAVSLLDSKNLLAAKAMRKYRQGCLDTIGHLCREHDVTFVIQSKDDLELYKEYIDIYGCKMVTFNYGHAKDFIKAYKEFDLSITSRFHGYIFSLLAGVPIISVGSNAGKIDRLIKAAIPSGRVGYIPLRDFEFDIFMDRLNKFLVGPQNFRPDDEEVSTAVTSAGSTINVLKKHLL